MNSQLEEFRFTYVNQMYFGVSLGKPT